MSNEENIRRKILVAKLIFSLIMAIIIWWAVGMWYGMVIVTPIIMAFIIPSILEEFAKSVRDINRGTKIYHIGIASSIIGYSLLIILFASMLIFMAFSFVVGIQVILWSFISDLIILTDSKDVVVIYLTVLGTLLIISYGSSSIIPFVLRKLSYISGGKGYSKDHLQISTEVAELIISRINYRYFVYFVVSILLVFSFLGQHLLLWDDSAIAERLMVAPILEAVIAFIAFDTWITHFKPRKTARRLYVIFLEYVSYARESYNYFLKKSYDKFDDFKIRRDRLEESEQPNPPQLKPEEDSDAT